MDIIEEQYVSFETAKLLKEKGFNVATSTFYNPKKDLNVHVNSCKICYNAASVYFSAPTQAMACRWLREKHNLHIEIQFGRYEGKTWFSANIIPMDDRYLITDDNFLIEHPTYEDALEYSIKYCLEHLI